MTGERNSNWDYWDSYYKKPDLDISRDWPYPYFKGYLKGLKHGEVALHRFSEYPQTIELGRKWHDALDSLRMITHESMLEYHAFIALSKNGEVRILSQFVEGEKHKVPGAVIAKQRNKLQKQGITEIIGDLHSHPRRIRHNIIEFFRTALILTGQFSSADLYCQVRKINPNILMGVTSGSGNVFSFRTSESKEYDDLSYLKETDGETKQEKFKKFWLGRRGISVKDVYVWRESGERVLDVDLWQVNIDIAKHHKLVLYRGRRNEPINREYPPQNSEFYPWLEF